MQEKSKFNEFTVSSARQLPVILLADVSGSMSVEGKIDALNRSVSEMIETFGDEDDLRAEIHVAVITFGGEAKLHTPLTSAGETSWESMHAGGGTPMGQAMEMAAELIENREAIDSHAYRPTVVLVSDGQPTDDWRQGLKRLSHEGRASKADRMALAIGADADEQMLRKFLNNPEKPIYRADDASRIKNFFDLVTMTVTMRSRSVNPNEIPEMDNPFGLEEL
ncbi:VWA domain-containing protein [Persicimonas caeni]|uniref:VWA domain-containing protein n=1 Tax=Persicimonas caeni TaxID=2292766 RepID=A0A4Y6PWD9_PERCE|nr:VWA domain-containing protein [Persicimonas caeni]QDG52055.1 VWA domain-containing protein [Persicimonas caeni]QED33276.1 VWA domain-containing protein [Persicimonas caeni]